jgi:threonine/homoserine/homoserine lactone efflux protein
VGEAIGAILPLAVGVAISPVPIIAVVLMLVTKRARSNGPAFVAGWLAGLAIVGAIVLAIAGGADASDEGEPATWASVLELVLGVLLVLAAGRRWRGRPAAGVEPETPKWMQAIDGFSPVKSLGAGVLLSGLNPKNLMLSIAAGAAIAQTGISSGEQVVAYAVFAVLGTIGVGMPVVLYFVMGERAKGVLERLKTWMGVHNAAIMTVLLLVIGVKLIGSAIGALA